MESTKDTFSNVLKKAQILGYAEPGNATPDLNGSDAMSKVKILSSLAFNYQISNHKCLMQGIESIDTKDFEIADQLNLKIKLLGHFIYGLSNVKAWNQLISRNQWELRCLGV